jgi:hypothetical protein
MHGKTNDEIKRNKDKARGTMKLLGDTKKVQSSSSTISPERTKNSSTLGGDDENPINMLLFGNKMNNKGGSTMMSLSLGGTMSSNSGNYMSVIMPLKHMLKHCEFTRIDIAS